MAQSSIEWTEMTWNPTTGCDRTSPGCDNCYALTLAKRLKAMGSSKYQADGDPRTSDQPAKRIRLWKLGPEVVKVRPRSATGIEDALGLSPCPTD